MKSACARTNILGSGLDATPAAQVRWHCSRIRAFTLLEMLVVIGIIGILAALALPSLRMNKGNAMSAASRQLMDDLQLARLKAITSRTKVYVLFFPGAQSYLNLAGNPGANSYFTSDPSANALLANQYRAYALYTPQSLGDQPGRGNPRYLSEWKTLPDGTFFPSYIFTNLTYATNIFLNVSNISFNTYVGPPSAPDIFAVPDLSSPVFLALPYIAFNPDGGVYNGGQTIRNRDIALWLASGSVFQLKDATGNTNLVQDAEMLETPPGSWQINSNAVRINWLTGRSRIDRPSL